MKHSLIRAAAYALSIAIVFVMLLIPCVAAASGEIGETIRVGWYNADDDKKPGESTIGAHAYDYEYLQALSQYTGWKYEYVTGTWDECLEMLKDGKIDIMTFVQKTDEREKIYGYPSLPMATTAGLLVTGNSSSISTSDTRTLDGITVGTVAGNAYNNEFKSYCTENNIKVNYKEYNSIDNISPALKKGEIDAAVVADEDRTASQSVILQFASCNQYFVTNIKNQKLLRKLNDGMIKLGTYCPYLNSELYQKYFNINTDGTIIFTADEQNFIKNHPNVLVQYDSGWPPIEYFDEKSDEYKGVSPDLFKLLSQKCGIDFIYIGSTSGQVLSQLQSKDDVNVLTTISYDYSWAESHNVYITQPFITSSIVKLGKNPDAENPTVAINEKAYFTYALKDKLQGINTVNYSKQAERLEAVRTGKADYTFVTEDQANYYRSIPKYSNLKMEKMVGYEQKVCISITKNSDPELMSIISKALVSITHDEMNSIVLNNTVNIYETTFSDNLYNNRYIIIVSVLVLAALIALVSSKLKLDKSKRIAADQANRAKSDFLSHVSHDIRTPLNAIIGITSLAMEETDPNIRQEYITNINESGKYLLGLINDTLDMSKIESGKMSLHYEPVNFEEIYGVILAVITPKANEKKLHLSVEKDDVGENYIMMDKLRFEQIMLNLLNNAVKFTPENGSISCKIAVTERTGDHIRYRIAIKDTGLGMSEEFMKKLFQPFEQERNRLSVENGGTGLGLSIVKSLIDMMGGTITCTSKKNVGTEFVIELEGKYATPEEVDGMKSILTPLNDALFEGKNILLAEDNSMNILVAQKLLEKKNLTVTVTKNGKDTVDAFINSPNGTYDAVLMDIHMPIMDGLTASKLIRKSGHPQAASIPIIALSANAYEEDRKECLEAGMNDHVAKPIEPDLLFTALKTAFSVQK